MAVTGSDNPKLVNLYHSAAEIWVSELPAIPLLQRYLFTPFNTTYWTNWPNEKNPYTVPTSWHRSTGVVVRTLQPATRNDGARVQNIEYIRTQATSSVHQSSHPAPLNRDGRSQNCYSIRQATVSGAAPGCHGFRGRSHLSRTGLVSLPSAPRGAIGRG
jgi:hypothetical protein